MPHTVDLLNKALTIRNASEWARLFNVVPSTITNAKKIKRLSPALAGNFAIEMGEDAKKWMLAANMENEKEAALINRLKKHITSL